MFFLEHAKDIAEVAALVCAALFFGYKAYTGYLRVNLSLITQCQRQKSLAGNTDDLVVALRLQKGPNGSVTLHDVQARVTYEETQQFLSFTGIERSASKLHAHSAERRVVDWSTVNAKSPLLKLVPGEETQLSALCTVPLGAICLVEAVVLAQRTNGHPFGQWKASSVVLPREV